MSTKQKDQRKTPVRLTEQGFFVGGVFFILAIWLVSAWVIDSPLIVPGPWTVGEKLVSFAGQPVFWLGVWGTVTRVLGGFTLSLVLSLIAGLGAGIWDPFRNMLRPGLIFMQAVPVLSIILVLLIWFGSEQVPVVTAVLMTFPVMTEAVIQGVRGVDEKLLVMAASYSVPFRSRLTGIFIPSFLPGLFAGASASLGLTWKVVVAAEVLAQPVLGMGTRMQRAKNILETGEVFAWTLAAVILSGLTQGLFTLLARHWRTHGRR